MTLRDKTAVVGIGATPYYKRGESLPRTELELAGQAILGALHGGFLDVLVTNELAAIRLLDLER